LNFFSQDLDREGTPEHVNYLKDIQTATGLAKQNADSREVWAALVTCCMGLNKDAATVTFDNLSEILGSRLNLLFATARNVHISTLDIFVSPAPTHSQDSAATELSRLSGLIEALSRDQASRTVDDALPAARKTSVNKLVSGQLDAINKRIKALQYMDALQDIHVFGEDQSAFDRHQQARLMLMRAACRWHIEGAKAAADDFLAAADLCDDDDKLAAARVRGLLLKDNIAGAVAAGLAARARFPESLTVWQITANARSLQGENLELADIPLEHAEEADALQVVAWAKRKQGAAAEAVSIILTAIAKPTATFFTRDAALNICLEKALGNAFLSTFKIVDTADTDALTTAAEAFSPRGQRLWALQSPETMAATAHNLSVAYTLLGKPEEALGVISEARSHGIDSADLVRVEMDALASTNRAAVALDRGRAELHRLPKDGLAAFAQVAAERGDVAGVDAARSAAVLFAEREPKLEQLLLALHWEAIFQSDKAAAVAEIKSAIIDDTSSIAELAVAGRILSAELPALATRLIDLAAQRLATTSDSGERFLIAQLMMFANRLDKAADAYELILPHGLHSQVHNDLLYCYVRLGQRVKAKELIDSFPAKWISDAKTRSLAMELGQQAGDWELLSKLAPAQISDFPDAADSWLFQLMVAGRRNEHEVDTVVAMIPEMLKGKVRELTQIASLEIQHGQKDRAMRRLYAMRRANMDSVEAASAHLIAHVTITDDLPFMEESLDVVALGTSIQLTTDEGTLVVYTLDPLGFRGLPPTAEFADPDSEVAKLLLGARVGAHITVADNFGGSRTYLVTHIQSAFRRLLELSQAAHKNALVPSRYATSLSIGFDETGKADFTALEKQLQRTHDRAADILKVYQTSPVTLGGLSMMLGKNILDIVLGWRSDGPPLHVGGGERAERQTAVDRLLQSEGVYILDGATLAELARIDGVNLLSLLPKVWVSSATRDLIEGRLEMALVGRTEGTAFIYEGELAFRERTDEDHAREVAILRKMAGAIKAHCEVAPAYGTKEFATLAKQAQGAISSEEHAVLLLAIEKQATLIAVDARLRSFASGIFGLHGVWPQALLEMAHERGVLTQSNYSHAVLKQFLANRSFVSVSSRDLQLMAYQGSSWLGYGMKVLDEYLASPGTEFHSAADVAFGFLQLLGEGNCHFGPIVKLLERVGEASLRHKDCPKSYAITLAESAQKAFSGGNPTRKHLLALAVQRAGAASALPKKARSLDGVQVLMCSNPPMIAHVAPYLRVRLKPRPTCMARSSSRTDGVR
jgi:tetratricopeptide (TPR) repeat protein